ncbi:hypothetical protein BH10ACT3_BH10ACT3_04730 [soil metagenome]
MPSQPRRPPWGTAGWIALGIACIPVAILAVFNKWAVLALVIVAVVVAILVWVWQKGLMFIEVAAFLIHFDGLGRGQISMGRLIATLAVLLMIYKFVVQKWRPPALPLRTWVPIVALSFWALISAVWGTAIGAYLATLGVFALGVAYFLITATLVDTHRKLQQFLRAYWVGGLFGSAVGTSALCIGTRSVGLGADPNYFGLLEASMIPLTVYYRRHARNSTEKFWYTVALAMVLGGAAGAGSRSGLIGGALAIVGTMVTRPGLSPVRRGRVAVATVLIALVAFGVGFVANPNNLMRGFADRGAGRLDLWTATDALIREQPLVGHGFGQTRVLIAPRLLVTPGSQGLTETRDELSSHNTWLDVTGDLGLIGGALFGTVFIVALLGLARPHWPQMGELSTTMFVMFIPVLSGSMFLPLLNNKLAWGIIGLSASLQVPSWRSRWRGLVGSDTPRGELGPGSGDRLPALLTYADEQSATAEAEPRYARWDLRPSRRTWRLVVVGAVLCGVLGSVVASALPTHYSATATLFVPRLDTSVEQEWIGIDRNRLQSVLTLGVSGAYAAQLKELSGVDLSVSEVRERMMATRPKTGALVKLTFEDPNEANVKAVQPYLVAALDAIFVSTRALGTDQANNEARPMVPGESNEYTGPYYLPVEDEAEFSADSPRTVWLFIVFAVSGGLALVGLVLVGNRRPRVNAADPLPEYTGLDVWTHVGGGRSRRSRATAGQLEQVTSAALDSSPTETDPTRLVIAAPRPDGRTRRLAIGVAAANVARGRRVLLIDAQVATPRLSRRLCGGRSLGLGDLERSGVIGTDVMRSVATWRLPREARRLVRGQADQLRFISAGTRGARAGREVRPEWLDQFDDDVVIVVLAPPTGGVVAVNELLRWSDATVLTMEEGLTTTADAEQAADSVRLFVAGARGIVMVNS